MIQNVGHLGLSGNQLLIYLVIMSYGKQQPVSVRWICIHTGLTDLTVRNSIKDLAEKRVLHRKLLRGYASIYTYRGLIDIVKAYPKNRETRRQKLLEGVDDIYTDEPKILGTNIDTNIKEKDDLRGKDRFDQLRKEKGI